MQLDRFYYVPFLSLSRAYVYLLPKGVIYGIMCLTFYSHYRFRLQKKKRDSGLLLKFYQEKQIHPFVDLN